MLCNTYERFGRLGSRTTRLCAVAALFLVVSISQAAPTTLPAAPPSGIVRVDVDDVGNARVSVRVSNFSRLIPADFKQSQIAPAILRVLGLSRGYNEQRDVTCVSREEISGYTIDYSLPGYAHPRAGGTWEMPVIMDVGATHSITLLNTLIFHDAGDPNRLSIGFPSSVTDIKLSDDRQHVTYRTPAAPVVARGETKADFHFDACPRLLACLAKSYACEQFSQLWVGRASFTNTGTATVSDYWVRFHLPEFTGDWSKWRHVSSIAPGQTIVDAYFPILDVTKMAGIEGDRPAELEVEYVYKTADGVVVRKSDSQKFKIMGRHDLVVTDDTLDLVMPSFVTKDDAVVQRIVGMVCQQVPGGIDPSNNAGAMKFMEQLYRFMLENRVVYQTPPGEENVQHVKFCRDVMMNHAGTCIDLAIFYASVCEGVGLEPVMYLPPGHCFPGIRMPRATKDAKGNWVAPQVVAIETTMLRPGDTFPEALAEGASKQAKLLSTHNGQTVDIAKMRHRGVVSLELHTLPANILESIGVHPAAQFTSIEGCWFGSATADQGGMLTHESEFHDNSEATVEITGAESLLGGGAGQYSYDGSRYLFIVKSQLDQDKILYAEKGTVSWTDADHYVLTCIFCTDAGIKGKVIHNSRQSNRHLDFFADALARLSPSKPAPLPSTTPEVLFPPAVDPLPEAPLAWMTADAQLTGFQSRNALGQMGWQMHVDLHVDNGRNEPCDVVIRYKNLSGAPLRSADGKAIITVETVTPYYDHAHFTKIDIFIPYANLPSAGSRNLLVVASVEIHRASDRLLIGSDPKTCRFVVPGVVRR